MGRLPKLESQKTGHFTKAQKEACQNAIPVYKKQDFVPPPTLSEKELEVWNWLVSVFRETINCQVSDADVQLMELYCRAKVATDEADAELKKDPRPYIILDSGNFDKDGNPRMVVKANPNIKKRTDNAALCLKYFQELGLSPLARARVGVKGRDSEMDKNIFEKFMRRTDEI